MTEKKVGPTEGGRVNVRLAHPLTDADRARLGIDTGEDIGVGAVVTVSKAGARTLAGAGLAEGVDPNVTGAVNAFISGGPEAVPVEGVEGGLTEVDPGVSGDQQPGPLGAEAIAELKGGDLDAALDARGLSKSGTVDEKRTRLAEFVYQP